MNPQNSSMDPPPAYTAAVMPEPAPPPEAMRELFDVDLSDMSLEVLKPFRCPNSLDCTMGHRELKLKHLRQSSFYINLQKTVKGALGVIFITWFVVLEIGIRSGSPDHVSYPSSSSQWVSPTPKRRRLAPILTALPAIGILIAGIGAAACFHSLRMRHVEKCHAGVEVYTLIPWWIDNPFLNWLPVAICTILIFIAMDVTTNWMNPERPTVSHLKWVDFAKHTGS
ncbi:hypothetical protein Dda_6341 [Drechslerella dactyloides]|uniref:Uncharacterized protein n=1 Tax=Drechslerella dactyloides TaxID=74499 RepID=A0AAD6ITV7_DREDA|nr:hypothetical protein Dda_6341 [Drechslerella dactyloides]